MRIGLLFGVLTLITGSLFANIMWGSWWNWDPRESSYLLLVFLYAAYLFLRAAVEDPERRPRIAAAYALFAVVLMPFLVFVAPRVTASLHPQTVINPQGKILMDTPTRAVFFGALAGFSALFLWILSHRRAGRPAAPGGPERHRAADASGSRVADLSPATVAWDAQEGETEADEQPRVPRRGQRRDLGRASSSTSGGWTAASRKGSGAT